MMVEFDVIASHYDNIDIRNTDHETDLLIILIEIARQIKTQNTILASVNEKLREKL